MNHAITILLYAALLTACGGHDGDADAYGNFEAVETQVSARGTGSLLEFRVEEGMVLKADEDVGVIDTTLLALQAEEIHANREATASQARNLLAQIAVQDARLADLHREEDRLVKLVAGKAATTKQLDDMRGAIAVQQKQISALEAQNPGIVSQVRGFDAREAFLRQQLADLHIINPVNGTVVSKTAQLRELATPGRALYRIAAMDTLELRAYVSGADLSRIAIGRDVEVGIDNGDGQLTRMPGRVSWISSEAEFTPKTIQTREERVDMVYAFKVRVANPEGRIKNGMPGEVFFSGPATGASLK